MHMKRWCKCVASQSLGLLLIKQMGWPLKSFANYHTYQLTFEKLRRKKSKIKKDLITI
jgi:hypothetical protein